MAACPAVHVAVLPTCKQPKHPTLYLCPTQLQGQHGKTAKYTSYPDVFRQIYARRGIAGLYSGIIPEYAKVIPGVAIAFCSYEVGSLSISNFPSPPL